MINKKMLLILAIIGLVVYFGFIRGEIATERIIGSVVKYEGQAECPTTYNGATVDYCRVSNNYCFLFKGYQAEYASSPYRQCFATQAECSAHTYYPSSCINGQRCDMDVSHIIPGVSIDTFTVGCNYNPAFTMNYYEIMVQCADGSYNYRSLCAGQSQPVPAPTPTPPANIGQWILSKLKALIDKFLSLFGIGASVTGTTSVAPGGSATFNINMVVANPDSDYSDGTYQAQYAGWALYDSGYNIVKQATDWKQISGSYVDTVTVTMPANVGKYAFTAVIIQYNMTYTGGTWVQSPEEVLSQEGASITVSAPAPTVIVKPIGSWFSNLIASLMNFLKSLFGLG